MRNDKEATLRKGNLPKAEAVREAEVVEGACLKCVDQQIGDGGNNPRARSVSTDAKRDSENYHDISHE